MRLYVVLMFFFVVSCASPNKESQENSPDKSTADSQNIISNAIGEILSSEARKLVEPWTEFNNVENAISDYYTISPTQALENADVLATATQQFRDSIRVERFNEPDLKIRLNVLHNTALRLEDMNQIPKISAEEITLEVNHLIKTFSSINGKLNNIVQQENLEKELSKFSQEGISNQN